MAPGAGDCPADTPTEAPARAPKTKRAISPTGAVRLGVPGSLSTMSSTIASTVKMATAAVDPINASRVPARLSQLRCAAQAVTAGAVRDRIPDTIPIAKARTRTKVALIGEDVSRMPFGVKKYDRNTRGKGRQKPFAGGIRPFALYRLPFDFFLFSRREFCGILEVVLRRTTSHAAVDTDRPYCGVAGAAGSRQRTDVVCSLPLVPFSSAAFIETISTSSG